MQITPKTILADTTNDIKYTNNLSLKNKSPYPKVIAQDKLIAPLPIQLEENKK
jgi:hypothetical protein